MDFQLGNRVFHIVKAQQQGGLSGQKGLRQSSIGMKLDENTDQCMGSGQLMKTINRITQYPMIIEYAIPLVC